jgi:hypothetical protein
MHGMVVTLLRAGVVGLVLTTAAAAGAAELPFDATITATAPKEWRPAAGLQVRPGEVSDLAERIADAFRAEIGRRGWPLDEGAPAILQFRYGATPDDGPRDRSGIELRGGIGSEGNDDAEVLLRLDLALPRDGRPETRGRLLLVTVSNRRNEVLWQARVSATVDRAGDLALAQAMVPHVLDYAGRDAFDEPLR